MAVGLDKGEYQAVSPNSEVWNYTHIKETRSKDVKKFNILWQEKNIARHGYHSSKEQSSICAICNIIRFNGLKQPQVLLNILKDMLHT